MLRITRGQGLRRRDFLTLGSFGLAGLAVECLAGRLAASTDAESLLRSGRSVVFLFQQGGPSQFETFDPKPNASDGVRTVRGVIDTKLAGMQFGETMSRLAKLADRLTVVRSFQTNNGGHNIQPIVGPDSLNANIGSLYARVAGATRPDSGMPTNTVVFPDAVCKDVLKGRARGDIAATGGLGSVYAPFIPGADGQLQKDMRLSLPRNTLTTRTELAAQLDTLNRALETSPEFKMLNHLQRQAYQVLLSGGVADALDLSKEDPRVVARYDTATYTRPDGWSKAARGRAGMYNGHAKAIGKQLLMARRLCEAGCGYVTIHAGYDGVWDMHADGNNLNMVDGMEAVGPSFDHAVAAFIEDIESRGLADKILLVATGEMGRTPRLNKNGGRDHWGKLAPLLLYGGGLRGGQVIGQSTRDGGEPIAEPLGPRHLISTILQSLLHHGQLRLAPAFGPVSRLADHPPIPDLT
jgi:uncharacterized protein (DUF1501 family)